MLLSSKTPQVRDELNTPQVRDELNAPQVRDQLRLLKLESYVNGEIAFEDYTLARVEFVVGNVRWSPTSVNGQCAMIAMSGLW